jgi:signal transduction histidine kinase
LALTLAISEVPLPDESEKAFEIGRISAELLRNVVMHARATSVHIGLSSDGDMITLQVSDDGRGGAEESASRHGLAGIQERAERISATFNLKSDVSGTHACLRVPIV